MIIAVDFDGVLHNPYDKQRGFRMGKPVPGALEAMRRLRAEDHTLIVFTVRGDQPSHVEQWLEYFGFEYDWVTRTKPAADVFIDDHAIRFVDWADTFEQLDRL